MKNNKNSYDVVIPENVLHDSSLTANAKLLYGEITALRDSRGYCWATNRYFAELFGVSVTSVSKWIKALREGGYIESRIAQKKDARTGEARIERCVTILPGENPDKKESK